MDWMHALIDKLRETQHEQVRLLNHIVVQQARIIELLTSATEQKTPSLVPSITGIFARLMQWPMPLYLISAGLLAANFKIPEVAELIKVLAGIQ